jgi:hypothetical protein
MDMMMTRSSLVLSTLVLAGVMACGDGSPPPGGPKEDSAAAVAPEPKNPHVMAIDLGRATDSTGAIIGGTLETFPELDTLYVSVRTQYVETGAPIVVRLLQGETALGSQNLTAGTADSMGVARAVAIFPGAAKRGEGTYRVEVLLDTLSAGIREFTVQAPR